MKVLHQLDFFVSVMAVSIPQAEIINMKVVANVSAYFTTSVSIPQAEIINMKVDQNALFSRRREFQFRKRKSLI